MDRVKRIWYLSPIRAAKVQASLRIRAVSPEPSLLSHTSSESSRAVRQKDRSLAPLNGWACAFKNLSWRNARRHKFAWRGSYDTTWQYHEQTITAMKSPTSKHTVMFLSFRTDCLWANSVDPDQTALCTFWTHYSIVDLFNLVQIWGWLQQFFRVSEILRFLRVTVKVLSDRTRQR